MSAAIPTDLPLTPVEVLAKRHATLSSIGFVIFLPIGILITRLTREDKPSLSLRLHLICQFFIAGPLIFAGFAMGYLTSKENGHHHFADLHKRIGLTLLILYLLQGVLGISTWRARGSVTSTRPYAIQSTVHVVLGVVVFALSAYQVHHGLYVEWNAGTGGIHDVPEGAKTAWLALIIIFVLLFCGTILFQVKGDDATDY
ncbi:hypothetical protein BDN72DRAFT_683568 [Pluteus cervinus]|uniref:Uncharacterized protein n=1 Tax=Pluteus cervinus TaxID=181527 RepID=A0ACD3AQX2_9AGAR|nr:hypothetical protein BDN72DRAFT_683568 [Pluteus cervinus]